jgi:hypothetical protein
MDAPPVQAPPVQTPTGKGSNTVLIVIGIVAGIGVLILVVGIVAALAIPAFLRARMAANETSALGAVRAFQSDEVAYATSNGGRYQTPDVRELERSGYQLAFLPGPAIGVAQYAYIATPISFGVSGARSFCADSTGALVELRAATIRPDRDGLCPRDATPIR